MTTAPGLFRRIDHQAGRLEAFAAAMRQFPEVVQAKVQYQDDAVTVTFEGHKTAIPMPVRDMAKAVCLTLPDAGDQQVQDSDDVQFLKVGFRNELRTKATFHMGDAMARNQR